MNITVSVKTKAPQNKIVRNEGSSCTAFLTSPPVKGQANRSLLELLSKEFDVAKSRIRIIKGAKSRVKIIEIGDE